MRRRCPIRKRLRRILATAIAATAGTGVLLAAETIVGARGAYADSWQLQMGNDGMWCEGCCLGGNYLCCSSDHPCKIDAT